MKYCEIIEEYVISLMKNNRELILLQDGATCHTSRLTKLKLSEFQLTIKQNSPQSSDLNGIEMIWSILNMLVIRINKI